MSTGDEVIEMTASAELDGDSFSRELEAQTGFSSYEAYLRASGGNKRSDREFLQSWQYLSDSDFYTSSHCCIMDLPKENSAKGLTVRLNQSVSKDPEDAPYAMALEIFKVLRSPVDNGSVRIVTWCIDNAALISEWVDVIGVGLQVPSSFFTAILRKIRSLHTYVSQDQPVNRFAHPQHLVIGNAVATLLRNHGSDITTVLAVFMLDSDYQRRLKTTALLDLDEDRKLPFTAPKVDRDLKTWKLGDYLSRHYQRLLRSNLEQDVSSTLSDQDLFYSSLLPFFRIASINLQSMHDSAERSLYKLFDEIGISDKVVRDETSRRSRNETYNSLDQERFHLRRAVEDCESDHQFFVDYVASNGNEDWLDRRSYRTTAAYSEFTTRVAKRLEAEIRDYMQLVVGVLSIEESRKSIQLSNTQLDEGKKVKIFTILAFIYVPLNLATSIFGMNLQQLNAEGQPVWVFVLTAIVATMLTASVWFCIDQSNSIRSWIRLQKTAINMDYDYDSGIPEYSIGVRLTMIGALVHWGYIKWMFRSNIWFHLLKNSQRPFWGPERKWLYAGHLVTAYLRLRYRDELNLERFQ